jgi:cobalamin synthase
MLFRVGADAVVLVHLLFILFVLFGGLLVLRWRWLVALHIPAVTWGAMVEFAHLYCPLTPLENRLRQAAGQSGYEGGFIEHYLIPIIYPRGLTEQMQLGFGAVVLALNLAVYGYLLWRLINRRNA